MNLKYLKNHLILMNLMYYLMNLKYLSYLMNLSYLKYLKIHLNLNLMNHLNLMYLKPT
jgi:hypothetical protein